MSTTHSTIAGLFKEVYEIFEWETPRQIYEQSILLEVLDEYFNQEIS